VTKTDPVFYVPEIRPVDPFQVNPHMVKFAIKASRSPASRVPGCAAAAIERLNERCGS
jgi:hypothetical protein